MKKRIVTAMLAAMMVLSVGTTALAAVDGVTSGASGNVTVGTEVKPPIYKVSVPTTLKFYIDPFEQLGNGSSITSDDFAFINKSNVAVALDVTLNATKGDDVTFATTEAGVTETNTNKIAFLQAQIPSAVSETSATGTTFVKSDDFTTSVALLKGTVGSDTVYYINTSDPDTSADGTDGDGNNTNDYEVADEGAVTTDMIDTTAAAGNYATSEKVAIDTTNGTKLKFVLDEADYITYYNNYDDTQAAGTAFKNVAASQNGSAVFRFSGKVNTLADWQTADIGTTVTYAFNGLTDENYDAATIVTNTHAFVGSENVAPANAAPTLTNGNTFTITADANAGQDLTIPMSLGSGTLGATLVTRVDCNGGTITTDKYSVTDAGLVLDSAFVDAMLGSSNTADRVFTIFLNDTDTTELTFTIKR